VWRYKGRGATKFLLRRANQSHGAGAHAGVLGGLLVQIHGVRVVEDREHVVRVFVLDASSQHLLTAPHSFFIRGAIVAISHEEVLDAFPGISRCTQSWERTKSARLS
jgi:hypothetical protein